MRPGSAPRFQMTVLFFVVVLGGVFWFGVSFLWQFAVGHGAVQRDLDTEKTARERANAYHRMAELLRPISRSNEFGVNFQTMVIAVHGREYLLAQDRERGHWFAKLTRVFGNGTSRAAEAFVRAAESGRLDEESLEIREAAFAVWKKENPGEPDEEWADWFELEHEREVVRDHAERRTRELSKRERLESELFAAKNLEWVRVPAAEEGWINASYQHCVSFFGENAWLEPGMEHGHGQWRSTENAWKPPQHATCDELRESWARVQMVKNQAFEALRAENPRYSRDAIDRFVEPWWTSRS
jgi:hypothetical protein